MSVLTLELIRKGSELSSLIFFPGGPGLSWHCFDTIISNLDIKSSIYGINYGKTSPNEPAYFDELRFELILMLQRLPNPVLVTHSFASMLILTIPKVPSLKGLILMNPAINNTYLADLPQRLKEYTDFDGTETAANFWINPSDQAYGDYFKALSLFYFRSEYLHKGLDMLNQCNFSFLPYGLFVQHFASSFTHSHSPTMPTLVIAGDDDYICPPDLFKDSEIFRADNIQTCIISVGGHFPWVDHPQETLDAITLWYETLTLHYPSNA
jgi:pimeloyl-ACP methyl ester carboxylesterase